MAGNGWSNILTLLHHFAFTFTSPATMQGEKIWLALCIFFKRVSFRQRYLHFVSLKNHI